MYVPCLWELYFYITKIVVRVNNVEVSYLRRRGNC